MGSCKSPEAIPPLIRALDQYATMKIDRRESATPFALMHSLGQLKARQALPALMRYATTQTVMKSSAFTALGEIGDPAAVDFLVAQLRDKSLQGRHIGVTAEIIRALGAIGDPKGLPAVLEWQSSDDPEILVALSDALPSLTKDQGRRRQPVPALLVQLKTLNSVTRAESHRHIGTGRESLTVLTDEDYVRVHVIDALGKSGDTRAIGPLTELLNDRSSEVLEHVVYALLKLDPRGTRPKLKAWLKGKGYPARK